MGSQVKCCGCWSAIMNELAGRRRTRTVRRAKYNEREYSIEFENLIEEDDFYAPPQHAVSDIEKELLTKGKFDELLQHQRNLNMKEDEFLRQKEEAARMEDEAFIQAKREACKVSRQKRQSQIPFDKSKLPNMKNLDHVEFSKWLSEENIDVTSPDFNIDDFDSFLEKMRAKANKSSTTRESVDESAIWEQTMSRGLEATKIAGDALNALQPVELHAVPVVSSDDVITSSLPDVKFNSTTATTFVNDMNISSRKKSENGINSDYKTSMSHDGSKKNETISSFPAFTASGNTFTTQALISSPPPFKDSDFENENFDDRAEKKSEKDFSKLVQSNNLNSKLSFSETNENTVKNIENDTFESGFDSSFTNTDVNQSNNTIKDDDDTEKLLVFASSPEVEENVIKSQEKNLPLTSDKQSNENIEIGRTNEGWSDAESDFDFDGDFVSANSTGGFEDMI